MKLTFLAAIAAVTLAPPAFSASGHCDADLEAIDTAMSTVKLSDADMGAVKAAREKAEELHEAGKEEECEKALAGAQKLLGIKEPHKD